MATTLGTQLVLDALNMAVLTRRPRGVIHHSDQGSQYTSIAFGQRCRNAGVRPSMGSVGDAYDNAMSSSSGAGSRRRPKHGSSSSISSRGSTIRVGVIRRWAISLPSITSAIMGTIPARISLPSCSRPSRTSPPGGPKLGPSLTAAARDSRIFVRPGTEEWLRRGPNKRIVSRRTTCRQIRYSNPKRSPLHETGASPFLPT